MKDTVAVPRNLVERLVIFCDQMNYSATKAKLQAALDAPKVEPDKHCVTHPDGECVSTDPRCMHQVRKPPAEDPMLACDIAPRPLEYPLSHYHLAIGGGPLHYTWKDKPHRLIYDLIAAVKYYAQRPTPTAEPQLQSAADEMDAVASAFAHKLALDLECVLADYSGKWYDTAMNTISAYRTAMNEIHERESPTFMGEPVIKAAHGIKEGS